MTGTAKTEEVEFEKTHKLETTIVPTNRVRARRLGGSGVQNRSGQVAGCGQRNRRNPQKGPAGAGGYDISGESELRLLLAEQEIPHNLLNAKPENVERESEIVAQAVAGAVTIATNMAGRGTDIILGGVSDYMARLKLREVLLGRLVKPEDDHKPPVPLQRNAAGGFADAAASSAPPSGDSLYPCPLTDETDQALGQLARDLVKAWGDRALTVIELEERIATAAEKAPTDDLRFRRCARRSPG